MSFSKKVLPATLFSSRAQTILANAVFVVALLLIVPSVISYTPYRMAWDDLYFAHRALCVNQAFWNADWQGLEKCLSIMMKSPIMALLSLPWGPIGGTVQGVGLAIFSLSLLTWLFIFISFLIMLRTGVPLSALLLASLSVFLNPFLTGYAGSLLVDQLVSWVILCSLLLVNLQLTSDKGTLGGSILNGVFWGLAFSIGLLCKVTFVYFLGITLPALVFLKWRKEGLRRLVAGLLAAFLSSLPALLIWLKFGDLYLIHAMQASWGPLAIFYAASDTAYFSFWERLYRAMGPAVFPCLVILALVFAALVKHYRQWTRLLPFVAVLGYLLICSTSQNSDMRFLIPVMIGFPFATASFLSTSKFCHVNPMVIAVIAFVLVLVCAPIVQRPALEKIHKLTRLLQNLKDAEVRNIVIATDSPTFNIESLLLSKEMLGESHNPLTINTLAYDYMHSIDIEHSLKRIENADAVIFEKPFPQYPEFTNKRLQEYYTKANAGKRLFTQFEIPDLEILITPSRISR